MKYWCCSKGDLPSIQVPEYGDLAIALNKNRVYRYGEDDNWHRDLYTEEDMIAELLAVDAAYAELNEGI